MKTIEKIYPSRQAFDITRKTSRLFTNKGEEAVLKFCEQYNLKKRYCGICEKEMLTIRTPNCCVCACCNQLVTFNKDEKGITQDLSWVQHHYMTQEWGYDELDIRGYGTIFRAKLPHGIKVGDIFNIYLDEGAKNGCEWLGTLDESLTKHLKYIEQTPPEGSQPFYFTFAKSSVNSMKYVKLWALNEAEARELMDNFYGKDNWAFAYNADEWIIEEGITRGEKNGLSEVEIKPLK